jgi:hypothetical protein
VVVDVSASMHADLPVITAAVTELFHKKARPWALGACAQAALRRAPHARHAHAQVLFSKAGSVQAALQLSGSNSARGGGVRFSCALNPRR